MQLLSVLLLMCSLLAAQPAQAPNPTQRAVTAGGAQVPTYRVTVVQRATKAINYHHRSGSTMVDFRGTALLPEAKGEARVESKQGVIKIDATMEKMRPATQYGPEYLTYVMWAITPEGRAQSLGEVLLDGHKSKLNTTTDLQVFGLIITAEPYFAVTQPSDVVVMENFVRRDTTGTIEEIDAKYELLQRGQYTLNVNPAELKPMWLDPKVPLELHEARNAVQIARWAGADRYAADSFRKALIGLQNAEGYLQGKAGKKPIGTVAREAAQMAEDARIIAIKRQEEERLSQERQAAADREARANADREAAERESQRAAQQKAQAERDKALADAARAAAQAQQQAAQADAEQAKRTAAEADSLRRKAEADKAELRAQLMRQLGLILETRDTARGLIMNMSDVLFDTARYTLRPAAREKLAKVSGILLAHPGLVVNVEGHTDSIGGEEYNQRLSEQRAGSVRDYLVQQGVSMNNVAARGFGKTQPIASNDNALGRQQNRRVELVVSGEIIGAAIVKPAQ